MPPNEHPENPPRWIATTILGQWREHPETAARVKRYPSRVAAISLFPEDLRLRREDTFWIAREEDAQIPSVDPREFVNDLIMRAMEGAYFRGGTINVLSSGSPSEWLRDPSERGLKTLGYALDETVRELLTARNLLPRWSVVRDIEARTPGLVPFVAWCMSCERGLSLAEIYSSAPSTSARSSSVVHEKCAGVVILHPTED